STTGRSGERSRRPLRATRSDQNQTASAATASSSGLVLPQATRVGPATGTRSGRDPEETSSCTPPRYTHDHPNFGEQQGPRGDPFRSLGRPRTITAVFVSSISLATGHWLLATVLVPLATRHYSLPPCDLQATGRGCSLSTTSVNRRSGRAEDRHGVFGTGVRARTICMLALLRVRGIHLTRQRQGQVCHFCHKQWITSRHTGTSGE